MVETQGAGIKSLVDCQQSENIVACLCQDFIASSHSDFFKGQTDRGLFLWTDPSGETWLAKQEDPADCHCCLYEERVVVRIKSNLLLMIFWLHIINYNS